MALSNTFDPSPFNGMLAQFRGVLIPLLLNRYPPKASVNSKIIVFSELKRTINEGGGGGWKTAKQDRNMYKHHTE